MMNLTLVVVLFVSALGVILSALPWITIISQERSEDFFVFIAIVIGLGALWTLTWYFVFMNILLPLVRGG